jgi:hypothetical protein
MEAAHVQSKARPVVSQRPQPGGSHSAEFELPGAEAIMHRDGDRPVIESVRKRGLIALLKWMTSFDEEFPQVDDPAPAEGRAAGP